MIEVTNDNASSENNPPQASQIPAAPVATAVEIIRVDRPEQLPYWAPREELEAFLHHKMKPYNDALEDVHEALDYVFSDAPGKGGFVILAEWGRRLVGALVMLDTAMKGYVPANLLLFVVVDPSLRGKGVGHQIIERALHECEGDVKLHVEPDNPARRLYVRMGFEHKYDEMRLIRS